MERRAAGGLATARIEYVFLTSAPLYDVGGRITAFGASARLGSVAPAYALGHLGYDARVISTSGDLGPAEEAARSAKRVVFGELFKSAERGWSGPLAAYRRLLDRIADRAERVVFSIADDHFDDPEVGAFYREALGDCLAVTAVSATLAEKIRTLTSRRVLVAPEPTEGARGAPQAIAPRKVSAPLEWLARRVGIPMEQWRIRLLWYGYPQNLPPLLELLPGLEQIAQRHPLLLTCVSSAMPRIETHEESRLRVQFVPWSPLALDPALAATDFVLIPSDFKKPGKSPNRLVAALHGGRFPIAHPVPAYAPYAAFSWVGEDLCEGLRWAIANPRKVVERIARGQAYIDERHSPEAVARFWLNL